MSQTAEIINLETRRLPVVKADLDDGYTQLANTIIKTLQRVDLAKSETKILALVMEKTYGYHKKTDWISGTQITAATDLCKERVSELLKRMKARRILVESGREIGINPVVSEWLQPGELQKSVTKKVTKKRNPKLQKNVTVVTEKRKNCYEKTETQKKQETITKETSTKDSPASDTAREVLTYLNDKTGKKFKPVKSHLDLINARLKDQFSLAELKTIVDNMAAKWGNDTKMAEYLRPATLFQAGKADGYLNATPTLRASFANTDYLAGSEGFNHV